MEKKNTVLLTVIAIATLLVAVVGATFAYFASSASNDSTTNITATTAKAVDVFRASTAGDLTLDQLTYANMAEANKGVFADEASSTITVALTAGDGTATCTYDLVWAETSATAYAPSAGLDGVNDGKEFTLKVTGDADGAVLAETNLNAVPATIGSYSITDAASTAEGATKTYTIDAKFYNLTINQDTHLNKVYSGNVKVANVECTNGGTITYTEK